MIWSVVGTVLALLALTTFIIAAIMLGQRHHNARRHHRDVEVQIRSDLFRYHAHVDEHGRRWALRWDPDGEHERRRPRSRSRDDCDDRHDRAHRGSAAVYHTSSAAVR